MTVGNHRAAMRKSGGRRSFFRPCMGPLYGALHVKRFFMAGSGLSYHVDAREAEAGSAGEQPAEE